MRLFTIFAILLALVACGAAKIQSDADISATLVGTWIDDPAEQEAFHGKATYFADGHGIEFVWPANQPESTAIRIESKWSVTNSVLTLKSTGSSNTNVIPPGIVLKDRIISISPDKFIFETEGGYGSIDKKTYTKIRVKSEK